MEKLSELEAKHSSLSHRLEKSTPASSIQNPNQNHLLLLLNNPSLLSSALTWLHRHSHFQPITQLTIISKASESNYTHDTLNLSLQELKSLKIVDNEDFKLIISFLPSQLASLKSSTNLTIHSVPPFELTTFSVSLLNPSQTPPPNTVLIVGCHKLSKKEYEAVDYRPLIEEIVLKEAIQPVILYK